MRHSVFRSCLLVLLVATFILGSGNILPVRAATTVVLGRGVVGATAAASSSAEYYTGAGSWNSNGNVVEFYIDPTAAPYNLGAITVSQIESVSYHTKNGATASVDFGFYIYTLGTKYGWYEERLVSEPQYSNSYNAPADQWNTWATNTGENQLVFYDDHYTSIGFYNGPTLANITSGPLTWSDYDGTYNTPIDYSTQTVKFFKFGTGSAWAAGFNGYLDTITIDLTTGESLVIELEDYLPVVYVDDDWSSVSVGEDPDGAGPAQLFGNDAFATIQEGVDMVADGGTVNVAAGTYLEAVTLSKPLTLQGASRSEVVIGPPAADAGDVYSATDGTPQNGIVISASNVTVKDLTIDGQANTALTGNNFRHGIYHYASPSPNLTDILIQDVDVYHTLRRGISIGLTNNPITVTGCLVDDVTYMHGIRVDSAKAVITDNTVRGAAQGISVGPQSSNPDTTATTVITGNTVVDFGHLYDANVYGNVAIYYRNPNDDRKVIIEDNTITAAAVANTAVGMYLYNTNAESVIEGNTIDLSALAYTTETVYWGYPYGIYLGGCAGTTVSENTITMSQRGSGIYLGRGSTTTPVPNVITRNTIATSNAVSNASGESCGISSSSDATFDIIGEQQYNSDNTISDNVISGFVRGVLLHEGSTYTVTATIYDNSITASGAYAVDASTLTRATADASANWWGTSTAAGVASLVSANVDYTPWLDSGTDTSTDPGFQGDFATLRVDDASPQVGTVGRIQEGIDLVSGSTVYVEPGLYTERVAIAKPVTLLGATHDVNKNGYTIPTDYAWDTSVESVIDYPTPTGTASIQLVDVQTDTVTIKGFVMQMLNARCGYDDNLLRIDASMAGGAGTTRHDIVIENNILGPTTNVISQTGTCGRMGLYLASPAYPSRRQGITNSRIAGNTIFGAEGNGNNIFVWGSSTTYNTLLNADYSGTIIEDNDIYGSHRSGIEIAGGVTGLIIRDNKIHDNSSTNGGTADTALKYGSGIVVIRMGGDKTFLNGLGADSLTITGNEIYDNEKNGIYMGAVNRNHTITGNAILNNGWDGLRIDLTEAYHTGVTPVYTATLNISVNENELQGNGEYGAQVIGVPANDFALDAQRNWWGTADGPGGVAAGTGDAVSAYVVYCPWWAAVGGTPAGIDGRLVTNTNTGEAFCTIQAAIDDADTVNGHTLTITAGTYEEDVLLNKALTLQGAGVDVTILQGDGTGAGIQIPYSGQPFDGITIADLKLTNYQDGMLILGTTSNLLVEDVATVSNTRHGIWSQAWDVAHWTFRRINASDNNVAGSGGRGLWIINGEKADLTVVDSTFNNNTIAGLDVSDGNVTGLTITGNTVTNNGDSGIGALGMQGPLANRIAGNTVTDNGRFGIEIKIPNGSGMDSGAGSIVVEDNEVSLTSTPTDLRDFAGIAVFRRSVVSTMNADIPTGVVVRNNTVSGYRQTNAGSLSEGFGIVVEGTKMTVYSNTVASCDVGIQQQAGHLPYPADGDQSNVEDAYFGRGNSPVVCAYIHDNTVTDTDVATRSIGDSGTPAIENADTGNLFCTIQSAIDDSTTLDDHTVEVPAGVYSEDIVLNKALTLSGISSDTAVISGTVTFTAAATLRGFTVGTALQGAFISADGATIDDCFIRTTGDAPTVHTIQIYPGSGAANVVIKNSRIETQAAGKAAIYVETYGILDGFTLENNTLVGDYGVTQSFGAKNTTIRGNRFLGMVGSTKRGIQLKTPLENVLIEQNTISGFGGAGIRLSRYDASDGAGTVVIRQNTLTGNETGVLLEDVIVPGTALHFNRIVGNTTGVENTTGSSFDAENNWWGCNGGPGESGCDTISSDVDADPWLLLGLTADPLTLSSGSTSTLQASLRQNSDDVDTSASGYLPDGVPAVFTATLGTVSPEQVDIAQSLAESLFTAGTVDGDAVVSATVDNQTVFLTLTVKESEFKVYLPLAVNNHVVAADLVVKSVAVVDDDIQIVIKNEGSAAVESDFWVDLYVNPDSVPTAVNQTWQKVGTQGAAWGVTDSLDAGGIITLTTNDLYYDPTESNFVGGVSSNAVLYAQVDSANVETTYGSVLELHEIQDAVYNNIVGPVNAASGFSGVYEETKTPRKVATGLPTRP